MRNAALETRWNKKFFIFNFILDNVYFISSNKNAFLIVSFKYNINYDINDNIY